MRALAIELRKMRRLRTVVILCAMIAVVVAMTSSSLFNATTQAKFDDPSEMPWATLLMNYTMMAAMTSPILMSVLASRQTDIEHSGGGWFLSQVSGFPPGRLLRAKLAALALLVVPAVILQTLSIVAAGLVLGIGVPIDPAPWGIFTILLILVDLAFLALHLWFAAVVENQLISVGIGMLGAFIAVFMLLVPPVYSRFLPWGYYAGISQVTTADNAIVYTTPVYGWIAGFLVLVAVCFAFATRRFDRIER